ncbi:Uncharacterised protein [Mycobacterium tuberculosis]|nr:Uncharacterised protein [Mycobacterium tuberculosis]CPA97409.1 Uncharacterised protein [Mycobacterium tuberculosis]
MSSGESERKLRIARRPPSPSMSAWCTLSRIAIRPRSMPSMM